MPSENHHTHYQRLANVNNRISLALEAADVTTLLNLTGEHRRIMEALNNAGQCQDTGMLGCIEDLRDQVHRVGEKIQAQRDERRRQLVICKRKKQAAAVYTAGSPSPQRGM